MIKLYFEKEIETMKKIDYSVLDSISKLIRESIGNGRIFVFGNGGSAATASHFKCDLEKVLYYDTGKRIDVQCLNDNIFEIMAISNDDDYDNIFMKQLCVKDLKSSDVVIGFSGSGNSNNVVDAISYAHMRGCKTVGFVGYDGGKLKNTCSISFHVPIDDMQIVEDLHLSATHCIMRKIKTL